MCNDKGLSNYLRQARTNPHNSIRSGGWIAVLAWALAAKDRCLNNWSVLRSHFWIDFTLGSDRAAIVFEIPSTRTRASIFMGVSWISVNRKFKAQFLSVQMPELTSFASRLVALVYTFWFKPFVFQTDKENQKCAEGAHLKKNSSKFSCWSQRLWLMVVQFYFHWNKDHYRL